MQRVVGAVCLAITVQFSFGCARSATLPESVAQPGPDRPISTDEPLAELRVRLELEHTNDCEERFDLELYKNRGVHLVRWDDHAGVCADRVVIIQYLSRALNRDELIEQVRRLAKRVTTKTED